MKNLSVSMLMLSCVMTLAMPAQAQPVPPVAQPVPPPSAAAEFGASMSAINAANAATAYTGNPAMAQQAAQPGQVMMQPGMQPGMVPGAPLVPGLLPGQQPEVPVTMRYDKKKIESGFYGAELPQRLFNNVPSEWTKTP